MADLQVRTVAPASAPGVQDQEGPVRAARARPSPEQVAAKREAIHAATHAQHAEPEQKPAPHVARENVESLEIKLPDGRIVVFGPPNGVALQMRIANMLGNDLTQFNAMLVKSMLSVRSIDGQPPGAVTNMVEVQRVANLLGEDGVDLLMLALNQYWPPVTTAELQIVKKNLRG